MSTRKEDQDIVDEDWALAESRKHRGIRTEVVASGSERFALVIRRLDREQVGILTDILRRDMPHWFK